MENKRIFNANTVEDAITAATMELGIPSNRLGYNVLDNGSKGFLGIGSRQASIEAWEITEENQKAKEETVKAEKVQKETKKVEKVQKETKKAEKVQKETKKAENKSEKKEEKPVKEEKKVEEKIKTTANDTVHFEEGKAFLADVFNKMNLEATITYQYDAEENTLNMNVSGEEMGVLIGKRGQTLDSLQYLTSLVVNKSGEHYIHVKLDTENYRERRKETLESLAKNIAYKVKRTRKSVSLEPMNPYERRIIHSALQQDNFVMTKSEGEDPYRHVVVFYKRNKNGEVTERS